MLSFVKKGFTLLNKKDLTGFTLLNERYLTGFTPLNERDLTGFTLLNKKSEKYLTGFTLVELLIVIAIIGTLASYTAYSFSKSRPKARLAVAQTQMSNLHPYLVICENNGDTPDFSTVAPKPRSVEITKVCSTANDVAVFEDLPANWQYTVSAIGTYRACTDESNAWEIICSETGCVTTGSATCP